MKLIIYFGGIGFSGLVEAQLTQNEISEDSLDHMIGQMIMIGIGDMKIIESGDSIFSDIQNGRAGGIIIYEKNIASRNAKKRLSSLIDTLQASAPTPLFISIDEEGGLVNRLKPKYGFFQNVDAQYLGTINSLDSTRYYAKMTSSLLREIGINMNYAPVVDVNVNKESPAIGGLKRSFSDSFEIVSRHALEVIKEHDESNVVTVLKHFPGHGSSKTDTHLGITDVTDTWNFEEIYPYKSLLDSGAVRAIMTAHIVNATLDRSKSPATLSKKIITGILRNFLKYDGLVISDDMQMGAINNEYGMKEAIKLAINAGVDMLMFANNVENYNMVTGREIHKIIRELLDEKSIAREQIRSSYKRIMHSKATFKIL
ncbi:MAG: glycoside hydrolase family 3 N-terminal domain-containing protein [Bacteroidota bacterium]